jgi:hypothetical protein
MAVTTIDLEFTRNKTSKLVAFLDGLLHIESSAPGLASYHAAKAIVHGNMRVGIDRRLNAVRKAVKQFNVTVAIMPRSDGNRTVRLHSAIKQIEVLL